MNPSGGVRWHWRAWRSQAQWAPTCAQIASWLDGVQPASRKLLLLGPSAGWMLPTPWLLRFDCIHAVDMDPLAPWLFARRHGAALRAGGTRWHYQTADALADLPRLLTVHPQACVLFDNLLGQLRFHAPAWQDTVTSTTQRLQDIQRLLKGREWGSLHDLLSGPADGLQAGQGTVPVRCRVLQPPEKGPVDTAWLSQLKPHGEWLDHLTEQVFAPGTEVHEMAWPFSPRYWHWLQAGWVRPSPVSAHAMHDPVHGGAGGNGLPVQQNTFAFHHGALEHGASKKRQMQRSGQFSAAVNVQH